MNVTEIQQLFTYTEWANGLTLDAAEKLSSDQLLQDVQISHGSILGTLAHMAGAEWIWLERWKGNSPGGQNVWASWTAAGCGGLPQLRGRWREISDDRRAYLSRITDSDLPRDLSFKRLTGEQYALPLGQQMQHVVNHATLHRGQVVGMIRQLGIVPPATDILFYLFEKKKQAATS
jgi:uncharacterized damage-inducible protein DinB